MVFFRNKFTQLLALAFWYSQTIADPTIFFNMRKETYMQNVHRKLKFAQRVVNMVANLQTKIFTDNEFG